DLSKWFHPSLVEHLLDGLWKGGLRDQGGETASGRGGERAEGNTQSPIAVSQARPLADSSTIADSPARPITGSQSLSPSQSSLIKSIAVLPFHNLSGDAEQEFFADGITEEILNALAQIEGLRVAGRSSAFSFKGRNEDLRSVGAKLNVGTILEGTLRRSGDRLRITAQLIDASNGYQLWSERYDRVIDDI